jgi:hypothetical protein
MIAAVIFVVSAVFAVILVFRSPMSILGRAVTIAGIVLFSLLAYLLALRTGISPFSSKVGISFGDSDQLPSILTAIAGAIVGVAGSYFFNLGDQPINWRSLARPLATAPLVLIPTIKLVEASGEKTLLALILLFALSYQNGFFWERLLKPAA